MTIPYLPLGRALRLGLTGLLALLILGPGGHAVAQDSVVKRIQFRDRNGGGKEKEEEHKPTRFTPKSLKPVQLAMNDRQLDAKPVDTKPVEANPLPETGRRLEDDPNVLDKLRFILKEGIPAQMSVEVPNKAKGTATASSTSPGRAESTRGTHPAKAGAPSNDKPCSTFEPIGNVAIEEGTSIALPLEPLQFHYGPLTGELAYKAQQLSVKPSGHHMVLFRGDAYLLKDILWELNPTLSINNRSFPVLTHWVHENAQGKQLRVLIPVEEGASNALTEAVWARLPLDKDQAHIARANGQSLMSWVPASQPYFLFRLAPSDKSCQYKAVTHVLLEQASTIGTQHLQALGSLYADNASVNANKPGSRVVFRSR